MLGSGGSPAEKRIFVQFLVKMPHVATAVLNDL